MQLLLDVSTFDVFDIFVMVEVLVSDLCMYMYIPKTSLSNSIHVHSSHQITLLITILTTWREYHNTSQQLITSNRAEIYTYQAALMSREAQGYFPPDPVRWRHD